MGPATDKVVNDVPEARTQIRRRWLDSSHTKYGKLYRYVCTIIGRGLCRLTSLVKFQSRASCGQGSDDAWGSHHLEESL